MSGVGKRFPGVRALDDVDLTVDRGEVLALIGENGAGKSTLMKIAGGIVAPDQGSIRIDGEVVVFRSVADSLTRGIAIIHQELTLVDNLSLAENLYLGRQPRRGSFRLRDTRRLYEQAEAALRSIGLDLSPRTPVLRLGAGQRQLVEIAKALSRDARLLILDEPTSSLSASESEVLFERIDELRERGIAVIYISHRLREIARVAKRAQVLRDGHNAGILSAGSLHHDELVQAIVGDATDRSGSSNRDPVVERRSSAGAAPALAVRELLVRGARRPISFEVFAGEVVGLAGLVGSGRSELLQSLFGLDPIDGGEIFIAGEKLAIESPLDAVRAGMALVPEDRQRHGLVLEWAVRINLVMAELADRPVALVDTAAERRRASERVAELAVGTVDLEQAVMRLSGGNQQKVVLGKWLAISARLLLLDEPTRGVDVAARWEIERLIRRATAAGAAVLMASSDVEEIVRLCDRVLVLQRGELMGQLIGGAIDERAVVSLAVAEPAP